jgi:hypothetical protein
MDTATEPYTEEQLVAFWRYEQLERMGFKHMQICSLQLWGVDLHDVEFLISRGCKHHLALAILEPLPA